MRYIIRFSVILIIGLWGCKNIEQVHAQKAANQLINESSPYLLQHAYNPVDWHPWGEEALQKAKDENKLLIISIGYAACHWCHVMEHESFEDSTVAAMMNEHFLPIKVDREERPDVDDIYMNAAQLISGSGGWPLNAFALPDGKPVWAGTYFPRDRWLEILKQFADLKQNNYARLQSSADQLVSGIASLDEIAISEPKAYTDEEVSKTGKMLVSQMDPIHGGRKGVQKFPMPNTLEYLLKYSELYDDSSARESMNITLTNMANGGIFDQVGGGFARYSVDSKWFAPHFEKMLYDNAQLVSLYSDAYRLSKNEDYKKIVERTLQFVERELMNSNGRFYSSLDADSEGEEGKFYIWTSDEIDEVIQDPTTNGLIKEYYNISETGNWEHSANILHITKSKEAVSKNHDLTVEELERRLDDANSLLLEKRSERSRPGLDDKILTSWNALMIKGYVDAYKALGNSDYLDLAVKSAKELLADQMKEDYRLLRNHKDGKSSINAFLDDYALTIQALNALYEVTFDEEWLDVGFKLSEYAIEHFYNDESKLFFFTSDIDPPLVTRKTVLGDDVIPGSNSAMARALYRLGELFYNEEYTTMSKQMMANLWPTIANSTEPRFYSNWLQLQLDLVSPPYEVAISGADAITQAHQMMRTYKPNVVYIGAKEDSDLPLLKFKYVEGATMIYVCQNKTCKFPVQEIDKAWALIK